jgi:hypothetical protein
MKRLASAATIFILLAAAGCGDRTPAEKPLSVKGEKLYVLKGKIVARDAEENTLRIDHEAVPGFMEAMTMDYPVRGMKVTALADQARITSKLHVTDSTYWLTDIQASR